MTSISCFCCRRKITRFCNRDIKCCVSALRVRSAQLFRIMISLSIISILERLSNSKFALHNISPSYCNWACSNFLSELLSFLDYCKAPLAGLSTCEIKLLQMTQNAAARLVFKEPKLKTMTSSSRHWSLRTEQTMDSTSPPAPHGTLRTSYRIT